MKRKAAEIALEGEHNPVSDALGYLVWVLMVWLCTLLHTLADTTTMALLANVATVLTFVGAVIRTVYIWTEWRARRKMIAINKRIREEEAEKVAEQKARQKRIDKNMEDILYAPTADEIAEILERNAREK